MHRAGFSCFQRPWKFCKERRSSCCTWKPISLTLMVESGPSASQGVPFRPSNRLCRSLSLIENSSFSTVASWSSRYEARIMSVFPETALVGWGKCNTVAGGHLHRTYPEASRDQVAFKVPNPAPTCAAHRSRVRLPLASRHLRIFSTHLYTLI
ncbi:hypothetical protein CC85DRAFT_165663 [Cutaneotrichosporon oleaginosum]|uniref:Uncharacterized protein n=1 Tax=Cutaneotrichosporon oleaginosum TaxID=879819 RepID=A0A0J0XFX2_9TREE|nr:uncharacterized protein CC85DRAFT_165663 [Cutaneotrichosporon oleaginosum]KLT39961.1 hypothetical protein CC85DRAFT_165663 [Cutaneotrichosporon oleaginosum]TXT14150.1 hypothetical protein COLE_00343 [Cutaneotrichosporon oleaginosum]